MVLKVYRRDCKNPHVIHKQSKHTAVARYPTPFSNSTIQLFPCKMVFCVFASFVLATAKDAPHITYNIKERYLRLSCHSCTQCPQSLALKLVQEPLPCSNSNQGTDSF